MDTNEDSIDLATLAKNMIEPSLILSKGRRPSNRSQQRQCMIDALVERQWFLDLPVDVLYIRGGKNNWGPESVTFTVSPISWAHPTGAARTLSSHILINMQTEYSRTGRYDKNLLYDTADLISFPNQTSEKYQISEFDRKSIIVRISIPPSFPADLLNELIFAEVVLKTELLNIESSITFCFVVVN
jgi:hypothetical protein